MSQAPLQHKHIKLIITSQDNFWQCEEEGITVSLWSCGVSFLARSI